jgi:hypothetical protein
MGNKQEQPNGMPPVVLNSGSAVTVSRAKKRRLQTTIQSKCGNSMSGIKKKPIAGSELP